jgi:hypothetical protein
LKKWLQTTNHSINMQIIYIITPSELEEIAQDIWDKILDGPDGPKGAEELEEMIKKVATEVKLGPF